jgi:Uma2 family endonuclease
MSALAKQKMTVDEFLAWAESHEGRYELIEGEVFAMTPQRVAHAIVKLNAVNALSAAIVKSGAPCRALPDGLTVRISKTTAFEPDALVYCGAPLPADAIEVPAPIIVVEVISPGSQYIDTGLKLRGYFQVPSVMHYLVIDPERSLLIHHRRGEGDLLTTRIAADGEARLDPPGLTLTLSDIFATDDAGSRLQ